MNRKLAVSTVVALAFLTGCGTQQAGSRLEPAAQGSSSGKWAEVQRDGWPAAVPAEGLTKGLVLPIEKYLVPYTDEVVFLEGRSNAEIKCMRSLGFADWRTETIGDNPPVSGNSANMERRYGITIRSDAEQNGYHTPAEASGAAEVADIETPTAAIALAGKKDGKAVASFDGKALPEGGCVGQSMREVPSPDVTLAEELSAQSFMASQETPEVKTAMAEWAACMKDRGHEVKTVWDAANLTEPTAPAASEAEKKIALAEVDCKQQVNLVPIWFAAERDLQKALIAKNQKELNSSHERSEASLVAARNVTASTR